MHKMATAEKHGFEVVSVSAALAKSSDFARVAHKGDVEVWASSTRLGPKGRRYTLVSFNALRVVSRDESGRRVEEIKLPETVRSNLAKVLAFLAEKS